MGTTLQIQTDFNVMRFMTELMSEATQYTTGAYSANHRTKEGEGGDRGVIVGVFCLGKCASKSLWGRASICLAVELKYQQSHDVRITFIYICVNSVTLRAFSVLMRTDPFELPQH